MNRVYLFFAFIVAIISILYVRVKLNGGADYPNMHGIYFCDINCLLPCDFSKNQIHVVQKGSNLLFYVNDSLCSATTNKFGEFFADCSGKNESKQCNGVYSEGEMSLKCKGFEKECQTVYFKKFTGG